MSGITLKETESALILTPPAEKATVFLDEADGQPKYKDADGVVHTLKGAAGADGGSTVTVMDEPVAFTASPAAHAGHYVRAGGDVTFDAAEGYTAGELYFIYADGDIELVEDGVTLSGRLELPSGALARVTMTSPILGDVAVITDSFPDAPIDGKNYGRKDGAWSEIGSSPSAHNRPALVVPDATRIASAFDAGYYLHFSYNGAKTVTFDVGEDFAEPDEFWLRNGNAGDLTIVLAGITANPAGADLVLAYGQTAMLKFTAMDAVDIVRFEGGGGGTGDVTGPVSSVAGNLALFADATGKEIEDGGTPGGMAFIDDAPSNGTGYVRKDGAWAAESGGGGGMANPMTTAGDLIAGGVSGAAGRLAVGTNGQVLTVVSGAPAWATTSTGSGDVVGPVASVADRIAVFDGTTGKLIKDGGKTLAALRAPAIQSVASASTVTPSFADDMVIITAQSAALTLANPTGTAIPGLGMVIRIKDNGTARAISYGSQYRAIGVTRPTTTVAGKTTYLALIYNATDTTWDVIATGTQA